MSKATLQIRRGDIGVASPRRGELAGRGLIALLLLPSLVLIFGLTIYPLVYSIWVSLLRYNLRFPETPFIGLGNYRRLLDLPLFWDSVWVTTYFAVASLVIQVPLGIGIALLLNERFRGRGVLRAAVLIPWAIPTIVNAIMWQWIFDPSYGALNGILSQLGVIDAYVIWLGDARRALNLVLLADTWKVLPFYVLMFLAALQAIPQDYYEAASIDGAGAWQRFRHITLPGLRAILLVVLVLRTVQVFKVFDIIYLLTRGGPGGGTTVISFFTYQQTFQSLNFGVGAAVGAVIGLSTLLAALLHFKLLHTDEVTA
jgi:ABC-type sugar transport system permease subunit